MEGCQQKRGASERFAADAMLGRLAKWLRILGCDTLYLSNYRRETVEALLGTGRCFLTCKAARAAGRENTFLVSHGTPGEQLQELIQADVLQPAPAGWFTRCLQCNEPLTPAALEGARENVPEYVFHRQREEIRTCLSCNRYYWPGTHRARMLAQLKQWGILEQGAPPFASATGSSQGVPS